MIQSEINKWRAQFLREQARRKEQLAAKILKNAAEYRELADKIEQEINT